MELKSKDLSALLVYAADSTSVFGTLDANLACQDVIHDVKTLANTENLTEKKVEAYVNRDVYKEFSNNRSQEYIKYYRIILNLLWRGAQQRYSQLENERKKLT